MTRARTSRTARGWDGTRQGHGSRKDTRGSDQLPAGGVHPGQAPHTVQPVEVRLIGDGHAVRALVEALQGAAACGTASYRPSRYGDGVRAYLSVVVPVDQAPGGEGR